MIPILGRALTLAVLPPFSFNLIQDVQDMWRYEFMRTAFLAGTAVAALAGLVGYFVVLRRLTFATDTLAHLAFAGALAAAVLGLPALVGVFGLTIVIALTMAALGGRARVSDITVGTVLAWILGVGVLLLSLYTSRGSAANGAIGVNTLFGSIFSVQPTQALVATAVALVGGIVLIALARPLLFASLDTEVAAARGLPVGALGMAFLILLAVSVAESVQVVGALLLFAILITPPAIAQQLVRRPYAAMFFSSGLAILFTWIGITVAFYQPYPVSFVISALAFGSYLLLVIAQRIRAFMSNRAPVATHGA
jgi:zinc/manganese transport system permease protein